MSIFEENLQLAFSESMYEQCQQRQKTDPNYQRLGMRYIRLIHRIESRLKKKDRKLIFRLDDLRNERQSINDELIYSQGMIDCVKLLKMIKMI